MIFPYYFLTIKGSLFLHLVLSAIFVIVVIEYTILFATFFKTTIGWTEVLAFSTYPLFLVSGYSWPVEAMPKLLQGFANILPSTPFYSVFSKLSIEGASFNNIRGEFIHLLLLVILGFVLLLIRFLFIKQNLKKLNV